VIGLSAKLFDPVALLQRGGQIHEAQHPTLGSNRYGELVIARRPLANLTVHFPCWKLQSW